MFHMIFLPLHQCQRSKAQQEVDKNFMLHALDLNCRITFPFVYRNLCASKTYSKERNNNHTLLACYCLNYYDCGVLVQFVHSWSVTGHMSLGQLKGRYLKHLSLHSVKQTSWTKHYPGY